MADGRYPDIYPDDPRACAGCGRLPEQVEAIAGPASGPVLCVDCVDRARASRVGAVGACAICGRDVGRTQPGARVGEQDDGPVICRACLDGLAAAMVEPD